MGNNIKTFEEYRFFKGRAKHQRTEAYPPGSKNPKYWSTNPSNIRNIKDPNEPFFNKDKYDYFDKMEDEVGKDVNVKNAEITKDLICSKMKVDRDTLNKFLLANEISMSSPIFNDTHNYWSSDIVSNGAYVDSLKYFLEENDYIGTFTDNTYLTIRPNPTRKQKHFDSASEYFEWWTEMKKGRKDRERDNLRKTYESKKYKHR
jgi:hypothetical protein